MKVGIIGSGGREHAICHCLKKSNKINKIFCFPGNAGTSDIAENIKFEWPKETQKITKTLKDAIGDLPIKYNEKNQHVGTKHKVKVTGYIGNRELDWDSISPTITGRGGGTGGPVINIHPSGERRMTVREYARIQTFPDNFKFSGSISSMYRQIGNAVPPKFSYILANIISNINEQI